jgi:hypothetical protein
MSKILRFLDAGRCLGWLCLFALLLAAAMLPAVSGTAAEKPSKLSPTLEEALKCKAPEIRAFLWKEMEHPKGSLHVGVIKFLVQFGDQPPSDNAGLLNWHVARRLEAALSLTLDPKSGEADTFRMLHIDSLSQDLMRKANHLSSGPDGRKAFFKTEYSPAWGPEDTIPAHVFLTGLVKIAEGARTMEVAVQAFDSTGKKPVEVCRFTVAAEARLLTEGGVSFALPRGSKSTEDNVEIVVAQKGPSQLPPGDPGGVTNPAKQDQKPKESYTPRKLLEEGPINFEIQYKKSGQDRFQKVEITEAGMVREPEEGTEVRFQLKRDEKADRKAYGVLFMVNGENTIYREEPVLDPFLAHLWILDKDDDKPAFVTGYLRKNRVKKDQDYVEEKFTVKSVEESRSMEVNYGPLTGTLTIMIFEGQIVDGKDEPDSKETEFVRAISRGVPDKLGKTNTLKGLQNRLQEAVTLKPKSADVVLRGLIVGGELTKQKVEDVPFRGRVLVSSIQLRYYKPLSRN